MGWWRTEWSAAARQDCQECSHARQYRNGPRFPAGTFPTVGSHREQLVFDNSFPPPRLSGEGSIHARTQTGTHGRSTTRRWPGGQGLCRCQKDARRLAPLRSDPHVTLSLGLYPTSSHLTFIRLFQGARRWKSERDFFCSFDDRQALYWRMNIYDRGGGGQDVAYFSNKKT